jgi:hypothetical protein
MVVFGVREKGSEPMSERKLMTTGEVARRISSSESHVRDLADSGRLTLAERTSTGLRLFDAREVEKLARAREEAKAG